MAYHDPIRQIKYLRQTLSQDKKPLALFISAGCPLAVDMPGDTWPLIPDVAGLTNYVAKVLTADAELKDPYENLINELKKAGNETPNIEDILSFLRGMKYVSKGADSIRGFSEADLDNLEVGICQAVSDKLKVNLPKGNSPYHHLAQWTHNINRETPIEIFTTNYDLLIEEAFERIGLPYFDGFVGSRSPFFDIRAVEDSLIPAHWSRVWKLHGSINWFFNNDKQVYRSTNIDEKGLCLIYPSHLKYDESRKMPFLVLIDRLNAFLRQSGAVLIISGYSFNDEHLNSTIINALKANPSAIVIGLLYQSLAGYNRAIELAEYRPNLSIWAYDEAIIGGLRAAWRTSSEIDENHNIANAIRFIPKKEAADDEEIPANELVDRYEVILGDFKVLGHFLHELIGHEQTKMKDAE